MAWLFVLPCEHDTGGGDRRAGRGAENMDDILWIIAATLIFIICILLIGLFSRRSGGWSTESSQRRAGRAGERQATAEIRQVLREGDYLFSNVSIVYGGRPAELDVVVVNRWGVFIVEVKNYKGRLAGTAEEYKWRKYKRAPGGIVYVKSVKNPIRQVKRQVYLLAHHLRSHGIYVWVEGYVLLLQGNSPVDAPCVLSTPEKIDRALHTNSRTEVSRETVDAVCRLLT